MEEILRLIKGEVCMGTYGLVELELRKLVEGQKPSHNNARDEICPFYKTNDMAHVGDGLGIPECTCKGKLGKLSPIA